jgi:uncharacterized protein (DUF488 family)
MKGGGVIFTIGHSNRPIGDFIAMLKSFGIETLVDIRSVPQSRYNPQFGLIDLAASLARNDIVYTPMKSLGGNREPRHDSVNTAFRSDGFRGYADYMQTDEFALATEALINLSGQAPTAIMCAEADPARCHRSLVSDALLAKNVGVTHILGINKFLIHSMTGFAEQAGEKITYPQKQRAQGRLF